MIWTLNKKISLSIFLVITFFGSLATFFIFSYSKNILVSSEKSILEFASTEQAHETSQVFNQSVQLAETIAKQEFLIDFLKNNTKELQDPLVLDRLQSYNINNAYSSIYLMNKDGLTLVSTEPSFVGNNYSFRDYFKETIDADKYGGSDKYIDVLVGMTSKELGYYFSNSIIDIGGDVLGVIVLKLKPELINDPISESPINQRLKSISLIDDYGIIIFSSDEEKFFENVVNLSSLDREYLNNKQKFPDIKIKTFDHNLSRGDLLKIEESKSFSIKIGNEDSILFIARLKNSPFFIVAEKYEQSIIDEISGALYLLTFIIFLLAVLAAFVTYFIVRYFIRPLIHINDVMKKVIDGNLGERVIVSTKDEIGDLGNNFNELIFNLQKNLEDTEKKVAERTKDLKKVNSVMVGRELQVIKLKKEFKELKERLDKYEN